MYSPYNPCCTGSFYGTGCTADCPSQQPVPRTTGDLGGFLDIAGGWQQFVPAIEPTHAPVAHVVPPGAMRLHHACAAGCQQAVDYGVDGMASCSPHCVYLHCQERDSDIAWRAYSKAWPEAMAGMRVVSFCGGNQRVIKYEPPAPLDWGEAP